TTPDGIDLEHGQIFTDIHSWSEDEVRMISDYRIVNRAREDVTFNLESIPFNNRRRSPDWFDTHCQEMRESDDYQSARSRMEELCQRFERYLLI
ncbi:MAG: hypothetical protein KDD62_09050, partial [Bdellovibrionales bacterium]|nr:hypothetical protein [Bdellovibrionales bacterium]